MTRLACSVWTALFVVLCGIASIVGWLIERFIAAYGPWVIAHADAIVAVVLTVCAVLLAVLAVAERARRDASW